jgi:CheY-like chemotaxis protein
MRSPVQAPILVATDNVDDARLVCRQLQTVFATVRASTVTENAVADFEDCQPEVLVLAFDSVQKSEHYYLGLYRSSSGAVRDAHRTVIFCGKDEVADTFELCRQGYFDDYVLYWPQSFDGTRMTMSVLAAARSAKSQQDDAGRSRRLLHESYPVAFGRRGADPAVGIDPGPPAAGLPSPRPLVLVVEDDEFAQALVRRALSGGRWEVVFAGDATTALAALGRALPDVILMDVRLPGVDGVALTRRLKDMPQYTHIPIVMMTGDSRRDILVGSVEAGASDFVVKPVSRAELEAKLNKLLLLRPEASPPP